RHAVTASSQPPRHPGTGRLADPGDRVSLPRWDALSVDDHHPSSWFRHPNQFFHGGLHIRRALDGLYGERHVEAVLRARNDLQGSLQGPYSGRDMLEQHLRDIDTRARHAGTGLPDGLEYISSPAADIQDIVARSEHRQDGLHPAVTPRYLHGSVGRFPVEI